MAILVLSLGCSVGAGEGHVEGVVNAPECGIGGSYSLSVDFFAATVTTIGALEIRLQSGSDFEDKSDGLNMLVADPTPIRLMHLGEPLALGEEGALVTMGLYLNELCPPGRTDIPVVYESIGGTITFESIHAPAVSESEVEIEAHFEDVELVDRSLPRTRNATLSGAFRMLFSRGRPAQRFP